MDVTSVILRHVRAGYGSRSAFSLEDQVTWTYQELSEQVYRAANALTALGVKRGDRVAILQKNCLEYLATYLAIARIGAVTVRLNWRLAPAELDYALRDSRTSILVAHDSLFEPIRTLVDANPEIRVAILLSLEKNGQESSQSSKVRSYAALIAAAPATEPAVARPTFDDPCMIMYTSGTTGFPKGAVWTHGNTLWFSAMQSSYWHFDRDTVHVSPPPMFHVGGLEDWCLPTLVNGGHVAIIASGAFDVRRACAIARHHKATTIGLLATMIYGLLDLPGVSADILAGVKTIFTGGSPILLSAVQRLRALFPHTTLQQVYGLTEGGAIATVMDPANLERHPTSVGQPLPFTEVRIARLSDEKVDADADEDGHLWVRSPAVSGQYYNKPEATQETFVDGWCRTGDLGRITQDKYFYITGRVKDMIISGGENIYPVEIENALSTHPAVADVAVVGVPDAKWGETPCAVVVRRPGVEVTAEELIAHVGKNLASYKKPRFVDFVNELPRNASGKVLKRILREQRAGGPPVRS